MKIINCSYKYKQLKELYRTEENKINTHVLHWISIACFIVSGIICFTGILFGCISILLLNTDIKILVVTLISVVTAVLLYINLRYGYNFWYKALSNKYQLTNKYDTPTYHKLLNYLYIIENIKQNIDGKQHVKVEVIDGTLKLMTSTDKYTYEINYNLGKYTNKVVTTDSLDFSVLDFDIAKLLSEKGYYSTKEGQT